jgi:hypothetical protein
MVVEVALFGNVNTLQCHRHQQIRLTKQDKGKQ